MTLIKAARSGEGAALRWAARKQHTQRGKSMSDKKFYAAAAILGGMFFVVMAYGVTCLFFTM